MFVLRVVAILATLRHKFSQGLRFFEFSPTTPPHRVLRRCRYHRIRMPYSRRPKNPLHFAVTKQKKCSMWISNLELKTLNVFRLPLNWHYKCDAWSDRHPQWWHRHSTPLQPSYWAVSNPIEYQQPARDCDVNGNTSCHRDCHPSMLD